MVFSWTGPFLVLDIPLFIEVGVGKEKPDCVDQMFTPVNMTYLTLVYRRWTPEVQEWKGLSGNEKLYVYLFGYGDKV